MIPNVDIVTMLSNTIGGYTIGQLAFIGMVTFAFVWWAVDMMIENLSGLSSDFKDDDND